MARSWSSIGKQFGTLAAVRVPKLATQVVVTSTAKTVERLQDSGYLPKTLGTLVTSSKTARQIAAQGGRPVTSVMNPTAQRARRVLYSPDVSGLTYPGEVVWTWLQTHGDHPVLIVGRDRSTLLGLLVSHSPGHADEDWIHVGDIRDARAWVRMDRVLDVPEESIRREGAVLDRRGFDVVAHRLCQEYAWR